MVSLVDALVTLAGVLSSFACGLLIDHAAGLGPSVPMFAAVFAVTLSRRPVEPRTLVAIPLMGAAGAGVGWLMLSHPAAGDTLFACGTAAGIWLRRLGPDAARAGALVSSVLVGILVIPVRIGDGGAAGAGWAALLALVVCVCLGGTRWAARFLSPAPEQASAPPPVPQVTSPPPAASGDAEGSPRRALRPSDRMALQMGVAVGASFVAGHLLFGAHWAWCVLTAFVVGSGNRGRGDVLLKGVQRSAGALAGTLVATPLAGLFPAGADGDVVAVFVVLAAALWARPHGYAYWAAGVTAMLSLLQGWSGATGTGALLTERLAAIVVGAVLGTAAAWWLLPVRSGHVLRRRAGLALRALGALLHAAPDDAPARRAAFEAAVAAVEQVARPFEVHRRTVRVYRTVLRQPREDGRAHPADTVDALRRCRKAVAEGRSPLPHLAEARRLLAQAGRTGPPPAGAARAVSGEGGAG